MTEMFKGHLPERHTFSLRGYRIAGSPRTPASVDRGPAWMTDPARVCAPENGQSELWTSERPSELNTAANLCGACPFIAECADWADETNQTFGVWGGKIRHQPNGHTVRTKEPVSVDYVRTVNPQRFKALDEADQRALVLEARREGLGWGMLAQRFRTPIAVLERLAGHTGPTFEQQLRKLHADGLASTRIAVLLEVDAKTITRYLSDWGLVSNGHGLRQQRPAAEPAFAERLRKLHADGLVNSKISAELGVSIKTVGRYLDLWGLPWNSAQGPGKYRRAQVVAPAAAQRQARRLARDKGAVAA